MPRDLSIFDQIAQPGLSTGAAPSTNVYQNFNTKLLGLLKQQQQLGTAPFVRQSLDAQGAQASRISAMTPQSLIGASPELQSGVRNASAAAMNPTISGANQSAQTFSEQLAGFGNLLSFARGIGSEYQQAQERAQDRAFQQVFAMIDTYGGQAFQGLDEKEMSNLEKTAGLPTGFLKRLTSMKTTQQQQFDQSQQITPYQQAQLDLQKQQMNQPYAVGSGQTIYDPATNKAIYTTPSATDTKSAGQGAPSGFTGKEVADIDQALRTGQFGGNRIANPMGADGYIDPAAYVWLLHYWTGNGGTKQSFLQTFDPEEYINPANTWVWGQIGIQNPYGSSSSLDGDWEVIET